MIDQQMIIVVMATALQGACIGILVGHLFIIERGKYKLLPMLLLVLWNTFLWLEALGWSVYGHS